MQCARHPHVETFVRCGKCDRPICPNCMVSGPVGVRCRDCSRQNLDAIMRGSPLQYLLATVCGLGSAVALGWMTQLGFLVLIWLGGVYGYAVGEATLRGGGRKRGLLMQIIAGVAAALGTAFWALGPATWILGIRHLPLIALVTNPWHLVAIGLGVFFAVGHVRYL